MTSKKLAEKKVRPERTLERAHIVRAFWKVELEPIYGRTMEGKRMAADRSEGCVKIRIDSPDADERRRDITFRAMAYGRRLFILGIGKGSQAKNDGGEETEEETELSVSALPKNVMEFFMDLRKAIETQWSQMQNIVEERVTEGQGIVSARFRYRMSRSERMQMNLIALEEEKCDGKGKTVCGSVRKLRETVE